MIRKAIDTPWKVSNVMGSYLVLPYVFFMFTINRIHWGRNWRFYGAPIIQKHRHSEMSFGDNLTLRSSIRSNPLAPNHPVVLVTWSASAHLIIGKDFSMTGGGICAANEITIGNNVMVGANCQIFDTDFHPISFKKRLADPKLAKTAPVMIEDNVFIGMQSIILKGVQIGCGSVVGAGSVVTQNVPARVIVAGNPARVVKEL